MVNFINIKRYGLLISFIIFFLTYQNAAGIEKLNINPTPGEISIVASTPIPPGSTSTRQSYLDLIDCGFNLGMEIGEINYFKREFELLKGLNFNYLIQNRDLHSSKRELLIKTFKDIPNFAGWKFWDEPHFDDLVLLKENYDLLFKECPDKLIYVNLAGITNKTFTGPYTDFTEFLEYLNELIKPEIWSYDFYPITKREGKYVVDYNTFYNDLEVFSAISKNTRQPFWAYCESAQMKFTNNPVQFPSTNEAFLRFVAFSSLAYGAQGIVYWTYAQRKSTGQEIYLSALINLDGTKTPAWYAAKKVNAEIKKYNNIFYGCDVKEVRHTGDKIYKGTRKLSGEFGPFKMIRSKEDGVMVSYIENNGSKYIVIVNRDVFNKQKISLELKANKNVVDISSSKNREYSWRKDINITLGKGGYVIFKEL